VLSGNEAGRLEPIYDEADLLFDQISEGTLSATIPSP
jgi:hypothetical protein